MGASTAMSHSSYHLKSVYLNTHSIDNSFEGLERIQKKIESDNGFSYIKFESTFAESTALSRPSESSRKNESTLSPRVRGDSPTPPLAPWGRGC